MSEAPLDPPDLPPRSRVAALLLLGAALLSAAAGQTHFALAQRARDVQYELLLGHRRAGLVWYGLAVAATFALCRRIRGWRLPGLARAWPALLGLLALVGVGGWLRVHRLDQLPPGLWIDEALNGVQAVQIAAAGQPLAALPPEDVRTGLGAGYVDLAALAFAVFDPTDGPYALRAVTAAIGTAAVAAVAALAWVLFGPRAAVAATAWVAVSQWHLNYSRWGEMPILSSLVETLMALALAVGLRNRGVRAWCGWLVAGLLAGAGLYTYQTFRLFIVLAGAAGVLLGLRHRKTLARHALPLALAVVLAGVVAAPMLQYAYSEPLQFGERAQGTLILGRDDWRAQLAQSVPGSLLAFQLVGDDNPRHNLPFAPLLSFVPALLAPVGLTVCLARWRRPAYAIVPLWFAIALVPGMITLEAPHASRLLDAVVPVALAVGVAVDTAGGVWRATAPRRAARLAGGAAALAAVALMATQEYRMYFVARERQPEFFDAFYPWESAPGRYLAAHTPTATVFLDPNTYWSPATQFVAHRYLDTLPNDVRMLRLQHDFPPAEPLARDALYLLPRPYAPLADVIRAMWSDAACDEVRDPFGRVDLVACRVPSAAVDAWREAASAGAPWPYGLRGRFYPTTDDGGPPVGEAMLAFPFCEYPLNEPPLGLFQLAVWEGFIDIPEAGTYYFRLHPDSTTLTIDGRRILSDAGADAYGGGNEGRAELPAGRLPIRITLRPGPQGRYFLWFIWQPSHRAVGIVPPTALHPPEKDVIGDR